MNGQALTAKQRELEEQEEKLTKMQNVLARGERALAEFGRVYEFRRDRH